MDKHILEDYINNLNKEQRHAATLGNESAVILAAAGSGKTSTLTTRIAYLIVGLEVKPHNILAVTFTNKAAKEMMTRLSKMGLDTKSLWVGTFHGICNKILRSHAKEAGLQKSFTIMDQSEQESFFKRVLRANSYDPKNLNVSDLLSKINGYKEVGWRSDQLKVNSQERTIYALYEKACIADNVVDFGELLLGCYDLFKNHPHLAESYAEKFEHILVDEFQDTNELQYKWLKILASKHGVVFAVGDDDQCFPGNTKVTMFNCQQVNIENIKANDMVLSKTQNGFEPGRVMKKYENLLKNKFIKLFHSEGSIESTSNHTYFVASEEVEPLNTTHLCELYGGDKDSIHKVTDIKNKNVVNTSLLNTFENDGNIVFYFTYFKGKRFVLKKAESLKEGDILYHQDVGFVNILKIETEEKTEKIYDLDIQYFHNFIANNIVVHNSIYSFRGAKPENLNLVKKDFNAQVIKIEKNYRSDANILEAANAVISNNTNRQGKNLVPTKTKTNFLLTYEALNDEEESSFIAGEIKRLRRANILYKNMALLYRTNGQSRSLEKALNAYNIPYIIYGGFRFFDRQEVKHAMAYLRLANNGKDNLAFLRVVNIPARAIGSTAIQKLEVFAQEQGVSLFEACQKYDDKNRKKFQPFIDLVNHLQKICLGKSLPEMVKNVIVESGLEAMYENDKKEGPERLDNLYELISAAEVFTLENKSAEIEEFLSFSSLESDINSKKRDDTADVVKLMTVHASKGLEFEVVFITGLEEGLFPHSNSIGEAQMIEEERRLMYVAITRAKTQLYMSRCEERLLHGQRSHMVKSRFFREIPINLIKKIK